MADLYAELGLKRGASAGEIKSAYRRLAKELHPDKTRNNRKATDHFYRVQQAYDVLDDEYKRAKYDRNEIDEEGNPRDVDPTVEEELWEPSPLGLQALWRLDRAGRRARIAAWCRAHPHLVQYFADIDEPPLFTPPPPAPPPPPPPPPPASQPGRQAISWPRTAGWLFGGLFAFLILKDLVSCAGNIIREIGHPTLYQPPPRATGPSFTVQPFSSPQRYVVAPGGGQVNLRAGPGRNYTSLMVLMAGEEVTGNGSAVSAEDTTWISVTLQNGTSGFIRENLLRGRTEPPAQPVETAPSPEPLDVSEPTAPIQEGSGQTRSNPSGTTPRQSSVPQPQSSYNEPVRTVTCILPSGQEAQLSSAQCRQSSGVIYSNDQN